MKCPKCGYLGFEAVERCRNCGYEFSLTVGSAGPADLTLHAGRQNDPQPLVDLALVDAATADLLGEPVHAAPYGSTTDTLVPELPLFTGRNDDDTPLITRASAPRPPLAVRRATPEVPRLRQESRGSTLDLPLAGLELQAPGVPASGTAASRPAETHTLPDVFAGDVEAASLAARAGAAAVDLTVLAAIDAIVVYFTMQISGLTWQDAAIIPKAPLMAFLLLQNVSYFVAFTAGGQTLGKMLTGIKIISSSGTAPDLTQSLRRTMVWLLLAVPAGLGLLTTLFDPERRGLHDRLADTRVVRAGA